jgi:four helix bundle protein
MQTYRDLEVWKAAMDLVEAVYKLTETFPRRESFGLASQVQRSIPANIAEGYGRKHRKEYLHHLSIAYGSLLETETHLQIAVRLNYLSREQMVEPWKVCQRVGMMLHKLRSSLEE